MSDGETISESVGISSKGPLSISAGGALSGAGGGAVVFDGVWSREDLEALIDERVKAALRESRETSLAAPA